MSDDKLVCVCVCVCVCRSDAQGYAMLFVLCPPRRNLFAQSGSKAIDGNFLLLYVLCVSIVVRYDFYNIRKV